MSTNVEKLTTIEQLAEFQRRGGIVRINLFVGSIISWLPPAGGPSVKQVTNAVFDELKAELASDPVDRRSVDASLQTAAINRRREAIPFESLWERVARGIRPEYICDLLQELYCGRSPNVNHRAIAWMLDQGYVANVFTTNYDEYLEECDGAWEPGERCGLYVNEYAADPMVLTYKWRSCRNSLPSHVVKLHGTVSRPKTMAFMFPQIVRGFNEKTRAALAADLQRHPVVFAGYGCNDWDLRKLLRIPLISTWCNWQDQWDDQDERCKAIAAEHKTVRYYQHNLMCLEKPQESAIVQLARHLGWRGEVAPIAQSATAVPILFRSCERGQKLEALGEILESLALRAAADVYSQAAGASTSPVDAMRLRIKSFICLSNNMRLAEQIEKGSRLLGEEHLTPWHRLAISSQLAFAYLMSNRKSHAIVAMWQVFRLLRRCEAEWRKQSEPMDHWSPDCQFAASTLVKAREILAHNLLRIAWFYLPPGKVAAAVRVARSMGLRRILAHLALRLLRRNESHSAENGSLIEYAGLQREKAHCLCLLGCDKDALSSVVEAEQAYEWGKWFQWQSNALRSTGWLWLARSRRHKDRDKAIGEARQAFKRSLELCREFASPGQEMMVDKAKTLLELKRLSILQGRIFPRECCLITTIREVRDMTTRKRLKRLAVDVPRTREPIG